MLKAGVVSAVALTLLVPTFNALNMSYVENVQPPPWMPPPDKPPNITPPTDFVPPEGDHEFDGEFEGETPPCPPPVLRVLEESEFSAALQPDGPSSWDVSFDVPAATIALGGWVNFTQWQASRIAVELEDPEGNTLWTKGETADAFLVQPQPRDSPWFYNSTEDDEPTPPHEGTHLLRLEASVPVGGRVETKFVAVLACGGMLS